MTITYMLFGAEMSRAMFGFYSICFVSRSPVRLEFRRLRSRLDFGVRKVCGRRPCYDSWAVADLCDARIGVTVQLSRGDQGGSGLGC